ncbi:MAG: CAP domain-containing protein [Clostridia bacterium]
MVGMIKEDLIKKSKNQNEDYTITSEPTKKPTLPENALEVFTLINKARLKNNLSPLAIDPLLSIVASKKAQDMVDTNYFAHNSAKYGTPFDMIKKSGISYISAGENIAGNESIKSAVSSWLESPTHKKNILSSKYNYVGIDVVKSDTYGYIIVAMFIEKQNSL